MKNLKVFLTIMISSLFLLNIAFANPSNVHPKNKLGNEVKLLLRNADYLNLHGECIETTLVLMVNDDYKLVLIDSGTDNNNLNKFLSKRLNNKKVWTRNIQKGVQFYLTVRFIPEK